MSGKRPTDIGVFLYGENAADTLFNQCEGQAGRHRDLRLRPGDNDAEHMLVIAPPIGPGSRPKPPNGPKRWLARRNGTWDALWADYAWEKLGRSQADITALVYEPVESFTDHWWEVAKKRASCVYGPDLRATHPIRLPVTWSFDEHAPILREEHPPLSKPDSLVCITSGTTHHPGHVERLAFLKKLRDARVPFDLFGRGLSAELAPVGQLRSKANVLRGARFALAIENSSSDDLYNTEKIWDALLCWCVPLYYGGGAVDHMIPSDAFIRLPDLGERGVQTVRDAIADPSQWHRRLEAIAEARRLILGPLRLVEWLHAVRHNEPIHPSLCPDKLTRLDTP